MPRRENGHRTARRLYPKLGKCENENCPNKAVERHHINGNTFDNIRSNVLFLCRRCHMKLDGRLEKFVSTSTSKRGPQPPKPCVNCGKETNRLWHGHCHTCNEYQRRNGIERPYRVDGRVEKTLHLHELPCKRCGRPANIVGNPIRGYCKSCHTYLCRKGIKEWSG